MTAVKHTVAPTLLDMVKGAIHPSLSAAVAWDLGKVPDRTAMTQMAPWNPAGRFQAQSRIHRDPVTKADHITTAVQVMNLIHEEERLDRAARARQQAYLKVEMDRYARAMNEHLFRTMYMTTTPLTIDPSKPMVNLAPQRYHRDDPVAYHAAVEEALEATGGYRGVRMSHVLRDAALQPPEFVMAWVWGPNMEFTALPVVPPMKDWYRNRRDMGMYSGQVARDVSYPQIPGVRFKITTILGVDDQRMNHYAAQEADPILLYQFETYDDYARMDFLASREEDHDGSRRVVTRGPLYAY